MFIHRSVTGFLLNFVSMRNKITFMLHNVEELNKIWLFFSATSVCAWNQLFHVDMLLAIIPIEIDTLV